jgi:hypothetical protein
MIYDFSSLSVPKYRSANEDKSAEGCRSSVGVTLAEDTGQEFQRLQTKAVKVNFGVNMNKLSFALDEDTPAEGHVSDTITNLYQRIAIKVIH